MSANLGHHFLAIATDHLRPLFLVTISCDHRFPASNNHFLLSAIGHLWPLSLMTVDQLKPSPSRTFLFIVFKTNENIFSIYDKWNKLLPKKAFEKMCFILRSFLEECLNENAFKKKFSNHSQQALRFKLSHMEVWECIYRRGWLWSSSVPF